MKYLALQLNRNSIPAFSRNFSQCVRSNTPRDSRDLSLHLPVKPFQWLLAERPRVKPN
jgi:hypothetical protein